MDKYVRLTQIMKDENGNPVVRCAFYQTDSCLRIHRCEECKVFQNILNMLCAFENIYTEDNKN